MSGLFLYLYNELATIAMSRTSALTASVANTAKRAFVIVGVGVAMGKVSPGIQRAYLSGARDNDNNNNIMSRDLVSTSPAIHSFACHLHRQFDQRRSLAPPSPSARRSCTAQSIMSTWRGGHVASRSSRPSDTWTRGEPKPKADSASLLNAARRMSISTYIYYSAARPRGRAAVPA